MSETQQTQPEWGIWISGRIPAAMLGEAMLQIESRVHCVALPSDHPWCREHRASMGIVPETAVEGGGHE